MAYKGKSFTIDCSKGGLSYDPNIDAVAPEMMIWPSYNVNLHRGGREKRGGTGLVYGIAYPGSPAVMGEFQFIDGMGVTHLMAFTKDGKLYKDGANTIKTGLSTTNYPSMDAVMNTLYFTDGQSTPQKWDGIAGGSTDFTKPALDWATTPATQFIRHARNNAERLWAINGKNVYYSTNSVFDDFQSTGSGVFPIDPGDGYGLTGMFRFGSELFITSNEWTYRMLDSDVNLTNWGWERVQWKGGAAHWRVIIQADNDCYIMMDDGEIFGLMNWLQNRDYRKASLVRPSFMNEWIRDFVDLTYIQKFHGVWDPAMRAIKLWVVRQGYTTPDMCLVGYPDRAPEEMWAPPHCNLSADSGYNALCSTVGRTTTRKRVVYTGGPTGNIWQLETGSWDDNNAPYYGGYKTAIFNPSGSPRVTCHMNTGRIITKSEGSYSASINTWVDGNAQATQQVPLLGTGGVLGSFNLDVSTLGGNDLIDCRYRIGRKGKRFQAEVFSNGRDQGFFVSSMIYDYKPSGMGEK